MASLFNINPVMVNTHRPTLSTMQRAKIFWQSRRFHDSSNDVVIMEERSKGQIRVIGDKLLMEID